MTLIFPVGGTLLFVVWPPAGPLWYMIGKRVMGCHTQRTFLCSFVFPEKLGKPTLSLYCALGDMIFSFSRAAF